MYDIRIGDVIVTVDGHVLQVTKESTNFLYGRDYTDDTNGVVPIEKLLNTNLFNFEEVATSAGWLEELNKDVSEE